MRVGIVVNGYTNALRFKSKVVYSEPQNCFSDSDKQYIDDFEEHKTNDAKFLGEGVTAKAFFSPSRDFVIKQNKINPYVKNKTRYEMGSLAHENKILTSIGDNVKATQRAVGYAETQIGGKFLVSKFVSGKPANYRFNPYKQKHIENLLNNLYELDKSQIIHPDLSNPNLLLTADYNVNIIDYQWAEKFQYGNYKYNLQNSFFPNFEAPNNALMFESAALPEYLISMPLYEVKSFIKNYLLTKSKYVEQKIKYLQELHHKNAGEIPQEMIDFEKAKYRAYSKPSDDVIDAEILKFNILNLHRRQYGYHDENVVNKRNILRTIPLCVEAWDCACSLTNFKPEKDTENNDYFKFMNRYGKYWQENMKEWYPATLEWIYRLTTNNISDRAKRCFPEEYYNFNNLDIVTYKYGTDFYSPDLIKTTSIEQEKALRKLYIDALKERFDYSKYLDICNITDKFFS